jgi:methionyl-tRNA formyltransferase
MPEKNKIRIFIATVKSWNIHNAKNFSRKHPGFQVEVLTEKRQLTIKRVQRFNPDFIFFPHWSWMIPEAIYQRYKCVVFHMTDLPYGRGGSPLQNLIVRGKTKTKISAIAVVREIDAGPVYLKETLMLDGSAQEVLERASAIIFNKMIPRLLTGKIRPKPQKGKIVRFSRRRPNESNLSTLGNITSLRKVYDHIRMLDAEGYPSAYLEKKDLKVEFFNAKFVGNEILTQTKIRRKS